jgi:hypothetical protein
VSLRVIFLDFDGVLNSVRYILGNRAWKKDGSWKKTRDRHAIYAMWKTQIDRRAVRRLNRIVRATGARIVVCSTWRLIHPVGRLRRLLRDRGFVGSVIGATPDIEHAARGMECAAWLARHRRPIESFVALDDMDDYEPMMSRLVRTSTFRRDGLEDRHVKRAIQLLRTPAEEIALFRKFRRSLNRYAEAPAPPARLVHPNRTPRASRPVGKKR